MLGVKCVTSRIGNDRADHLIGGVRRGSADRTPNTASARSRWCLPKHGRRGPPPMVDGAIWRTARWTSRRTTSLAPTRLLPPEPSWRGACRRPHPRCTESTLYQSTLYRLHAAPHPRSIDSTATPTGPSASAISPFGANRTRRARPLHAVGPLLPLLGYCCCPPATDQPDKRSPVGRVDRDARAWSRQSHPLPPNGPVGSGPSARRRGCTESVSAISPFGHKSDRTRPTCPHCRGTTAAHRTLLPSTSGR